MTQHGLDIFSTTKFIIKLHFHTCCWCLLLFEFYISGILCSQADTLHLHVIVHEWLAFYINYSAFLYIHRGVLTSYSAVWKLLSWCHTSAAISAHSVYTIQPCTVSHHFMQSLIHRVHRCLTATCHLHFWQNDQDLLHATDVTHKTRGSGMDTWMGQHRKLTLEMKILPPLLPDLNPRPFNDKSVTLTTELSLLPMYISWSCMSPSVSQ